MTRSAAASAAAFDSMSDDDAAAALATCLHAEEWVASLLDGRPYQSSAALTGRAMAAARALTDAGLEQALAAHPRIGDRPAGAGAAAAFSRAEQSGVTDEAAARGALREANAAYEARFGQVFLIRAAGRDAVQILAEAHRRLGNEAAAEAAEVRVQLGEIAVLRLTQLLAQP